MCRELSIYYIINYPTLHLQAVLAPDQGFLKVEKQAAREGEKSQKKQAKGSLLTILTKNPKQQSQE